MSNVIYIDVPSDYNYNYSLSGKCAEALQSEQNIQGAVTFICNSVAKISNGDVYQVTFDNLLGEDDKLLFIIKHGFPILESAKAEEYILKRRRKA